MTWDPNPPTEPPVTPTGSAFPGSDRSDTPTWEQGSFDSGPGPGPSAGGPPSPPNPAWPASTEPTRVVLASWNESTAPTAPGDPGSAYGTIPPPPLPPHPPTMDASWAGPPVPSPRRGRRAARAVGATLASVVLVLAGFGVRALTEGEAATSVVRNPAPVATVPDVTIDREVEPLAAVAAAVSPSVVQIEPSNGLGSGVVYGNGLILTNAHVVGSTATVTVRVADGRALQGRVLGVDTGTDVAVVRVDADDLPAVAITGTEPVVGQTAVALGSPFGLDQTVTAGIVSAVDRPVDNNMGIAVNMIQTDASINPGNSGGALVDRNGALIGINTAIFSQSGENNGIGFAIPVGTALDVAAKIVAGESTAKAGLGLTGPSDTPSGEPGAQVQSVTPGGPADVAGIRAGDKVVGVDDKAIRSFDQLRGVISAYTPGDQVTVTLEREGQTLTLDVTLGTLGG